MHLHDYLARIDYRGSLEPNYETLAALHQAHLLAISYENLDIHLGRYLALDERAIFDKIVTRGRGGWCYEMNGLFAWALREIGFRVTLLASAVNRASQGANAERNHLILLVTLDRPYLVDVGFGNGLQRPIPLEPGTYTQGFLQYQLACEDGYWIFQNHPQGGPGFDFTLEPYRLADFLDKSHELQTSPESGFVRVTVCHRFTPNSLLTLHAATLRTITADGALDLVIEDEAAYRRLLREQFTLRLSDAEIATLWRVAWQQHQAWQRAQA